MSIPKILLRLRMLTAREKSSGIYRRLNIIEVPTVEKSVREDALEIQDIRELGLGWAWFVNDRASISSGMAGHGIGISFS